MGVPRKLCARATRSSMYVVRSLCTCVSFFIFKHVIQWAARLGGGVGAAVAPYACPFRRVHARLAARVGAGVPWGIRVDGLIWTMSAEHACAMRVCLPL